MLCSLPQLPLKLLLLLLLLSLFECVCLVCISLSLNLPLPLPVLNRPALPPSLYLACPPLRLSAPILQPHPTHSLKSFDADSPTIPGLHTLAGPCRSRRAGCSVVLIALDASLDAACSLVLAQPPPPPPSSAFDRSNAWMRLSI